MIPAYNGKVEGVCRRGSEQGQSLWGPLWGFIEIFRLGYESESKKKEIPAHGLSAVIIIGGRDLNSVEDKLNNYIGDDAIDLEGDLRLFLGELHLYIKKRRFSTLDNHQIPSQTQCLIKQAPRQRRQQ